MEIRPYLLMKLVRRVANVALDLRLLNPFGRKRKRHRLLVGELWLERAPVYGPTV